MSNSEHFTVKVSSNPLIVKLDNIPTLIFLLDLVTSIVCESEIYSDNFPNIKYKIAYLFN